MTNRHLQFCVGDKQAAATVASFGHPIDESQGRNTAAAIALHAFIPSAESLVCRSMRLELSNCRCHTLEVKNVVSVRSRGVNGV